MRHAVTACRAGGEAVAPLIDLGSSPVANHLPDRPDTHPPRYPLGLVACTGCALVQNVTCLPGALLFDPAYPYFASVSQAVRRHAEGIAQALAARLPPGARTLEVGSNDGAVQLALRARGIDCLGVDPAQGPAQAAQARGLRVLIRPFDDDAADLILARERPFDAAHLSNVLAHVADPAALLRAIRRCLVPGGVLMVEVQSWRALAESGAFDMIYHEHHSHFSLTSATALLGACGFGVTGVEDIAMQGGSLRLWCRAGHGHAPAVLDRIAAETPALHDAPALLRASLARFRTDAARFLDALGDRALFGYGAAAKTVTILAASGLDWPLRAVADAAPSKAGRYLPVGDIPIIAPADLPTQGAEMFLFAWNLAAEIAPRLTGWRVHVPVPRLHAIA